jgi:hypothetical protein
MKFSIVDVCFIWVSFHFVWCGSLRNNTVKLATETGLTTLLLTKLWEICRDSTGKANPKSTLRKALFWKKRNFNESPTTNGNFKRLWPYDLLARKVSWSNSQHTWTVTLAVLGKRSNTPCSFSSLKPGEEAFHASIHFNHSSVYSVAFMQYNLNLFTLSFSLYFSF